MKKLFLASMLFSAVANASTVAIIDSGVDYKHRDLAPQMWQNLVDSSENQRDEDKNGYQDDIFGWNFAESNNLVIDYKYLGTFSQDPYTFFEIQARMFSGTVTAEDRAWIDEKRKDPNFIKEMGKFGNFVHGTHVAGIAAKNSPEAKILAVKLIPTEVKLPGRGKQNLGDGEGRMNALKAALEQLAMQQSTMLGEIGEYVNNHKADIANCSFGTGYAQAKTIVATLYKVIFFKAPTEEQLKEPTLHFMNAMVKHGQKLVDHAPNTLFVIAAGNDGADNDVEPTSPANIKADNTITVAATYGRSKLAVFSSYGATMVEVAAPGVIIESSVPGDEYLKVSGTSQASPYVANVASQIKDANKALAPKDIKKILMGTVDLKDYLNGKVISSGIVNPERAVLAAELSKTMSVDQAISSAKVRVQDVPVSKQKSATKQAKDADLYVLPLPSLFI